MEKARWKDIAIINFTILAFLGLALWGYILDYATWIHDWYNHNAFLGTLVFMFSVAGYILLVSQTTFYFHSKSKGEDESNGI